MRNAVVKADGSPMCFDDLHHQLQAQAMLRTFIALPGACNVISPIQHFQEFRSDPHSIIGNHTQTTAISFADRQHDPASLGIMGDAVADQVIQHTPQEPIIPQKVNGPTRMHFSKYELIAAFQPAVQDFADCLPADLHPVHVFETDGLKRIFQFGSQVQLVDQSSHLLAFPPDNSCLFSGLLRKGSVIFQFAGISQNHRKRCADIMGNTADPFRSCVILFPHIIRSPVQPGVDLSQFSLFLKILRPAVA